MQARVTAVLVAQNGAERLSRTLDALRAQTRQPESLVVVDVSSTDGTAKLLSEAQPTGFLSASSRLSFGVAVNHALGVVSPPASDDEWLWLLAHDTAPEPDALAALLAAVEVNPSVAVAGPKQMEWNDSGFIAGFGESVTRFGASVPLVERELDQAQHDRLSDVLGVGAAGMLVRHSVWNALGGFDPALPTADNGLDFSIRARLAGHRVIAVPAAKVVTAGDGLSGPGTSIKGSQRRRRQSVRRAAQLHRRLVYAPAFTVFFHWLSLVPLAVLRTLFQVLRKQPGAVAGEFAAAFRTAFSGRVGAARRSIKTTRKVGWGAVAPLRIPGAEVRRRNALVRELALSQARGSREELNFFSTGGAAIVLAALVVGFALFFPLFGGKALAGGSFLPLSADVGGLWANIGYGWRDLGLGFVGASDPFSYILAVFGSITFWSPSVSLVVLYLVSLPLAALAGWFAAAKLTNRSGLRIFGAVLWAIAPPLLSALDAGQVGAIVAHLLLPWLVLAALSAARSWSASAIASLLFAAVTAAAPSLWPALLVLWLASVIFARRAVMRYVGLPIPALLLVAPLAYEQFMRGNLWGIFADPGLPNAHGTVSVTDLLLGLPEQGLGGWSGIGGTLGIDSQTLQFIALLLLVPLALIAVAALFLPRSWRASAAIGFAILGFATAVGATLIQVSASGSFEVTIWPGAGLSLYWLGLVGAATMGLATFTRLAALPAVIAALAVAVLAVPVAASTLTATSDVRSSTGASLPAFVTAEAASNPRVGTLVLGAEANGGLTASVVHGVGATLETQSTLAATTGEPTAAEQNLSTLVGNLASRSGTDASVALANLGVEFIVLSPTTSSATPDAQAVVARATSAFDSNASLTAIGQTFAGELWQITGTPGFSALPAPTPTNTGTPIGFVILLVQAIVFGLLLLLALPAGRLEAHGLRAASTVDVLDQPGEPVEPLEPDDSVRDDQSGDAGGAAVDETGGLDAPPTIGTVATADDASGLPVSAGVAAVGEAVTPAAASVATAATAGAKRRKIFARKPKRVPVPVPVDAVVEPANPAEPVDSGELAEPAVDVAPDATQVDVRAVPDTVPNSDADTDTNTDADADAVNTDADAVNTDAAPASSAAVPDETAPADDAAVPNESDEHAADGMNPTPGEEVHRGTNTEER
ncbi:glycosyltransferase family 2 protein [Subtercola vilae]|uniref:Glycosyltransferase family 2 protein n=1 Tax=Subtercola vilae TaxID=2056433 RepID=A0A4T2C125_9MICO|nr:glycosyltransferase family 2 protein [Subtercola vilae]TIH37825.1 glycosyltransferase family 2 protein [Subtercola vilae]